MEMVISVGRSVFIWCRSELPVHVGNKKQFYYSFNNSYRQFILKWLKLRWSAPITPPKGKSLKGKIKAHQWLDRWVKPTGIAHPPKLADCCWMREPRPSNRETSQPTLRITRDNIFLYSLLYVLGHYFMLQWIMKTSIKQSIYSTCLENVASLPFASSPLHILFKREEITLPPGPASTGQKSLTLTT